MEEEEEDKILLNSLGVTSLAPEAIERKLFLQVKNDDKNEYAESSEEHGLVEEHRAVEYAEGSDSLSTSCAKLYNKLQAVEVEISVVASSIAEEKCEPLDNDKEIVDDSKKTVEPVEITLDGLSLQQALAKDRLQSLQRTKAQLKKEISQFEGRPSAGNTVYEKLLDGLVEEKPKRKLKRVRELSKKGLKRHSKTVAYDEDANFDAVLDAASAGFVETEREELIRKGKLTPFHKIKGFERRVEHAGPSNRNVVLEETSNEDLGSLSIAKVAQSMADIASNRPSTKLLDLEALPVLDPPARPFHRLGRPLKVPPSREDDKEKRKRKLGKLKRPLPDKKWGIYDLQKENLSDIRVEDAAISHFDTENQNEAVEDEEPSYVVLEGGLKIPNSVYMKLFDYQKVGVQWLWELHCQRAGGIIGDEMGLGKTIQVISFLAALHFSKMYKLSIIVCPVTLLRQWQREAHKWYPHFYVEILHDSAHGQPLSRSNESNFNSEASSDSDLENHVRSKSKISWDYVIDRIVRSEAGLLLTTYEQLRIHSEKLLGIEWGYAVLDEGHRIRNPNAEVTLVCKQLQTVHRIIMTGAPVQNKLSELWSLFDFVFPGKLGVLPVFETEFAVPITVGGYANATPLQVSTAYRCAVVLRDLIMPYLLRRMKADVQAQLPKKTEHVLFCALTQEQRSVYRAFLASSEVEQIFDGNRNSLYGIDVLRKICNHPDLLEREHSHRHADYGNPDRSGKMKVVVQVLKVWKEQGHRVLLFAQTQQVLDIVEIYLCRSEYSYRRMDGSTPVKQRTALMDEFNNYSEIFIFILTTKVGGLGTNLTGADRVIIYDPDWNPSTDIQARERAWRIGQKRDVTVYRLITRGTIEEKVYHRQIYKHFLTNRILKNPKQRRFFKARDMKDLFTLQDDGDDNASETSNIFGQLSGNLSLEIRNSQDGQAFLAKESSPGIERQENGDQSNGSMDEQNILKCLLDAQGIHSAINHDVIMNAHDDDKARMEEQASRVAQRAAEALRESRMLRSRESFATPTWTGKSGVAGAPLAIRRKFGSAVNTQMLGASRQMEGGYALGQFAAAGASSGKALSSADLLAKIRGRQEKAIGDALEQDLGLASGSSRENVRVSENAMTSRTNGRLAIVQPEVMIRQLCTFIQRKGGEAESASITQHFKDRIQSKDLPLFKSLLKEIARLEKDVSGARWVLKPDYQ